MDVPANSSKRLAIGMVGVLVAVGFAAASTPSKSALLQGEAEIQLVTAGPGTLTISPAENEPEADCRVDVQLPESEGCVQRYESGTRVTLEAAPDDGHTFAGWSDFKCRRASLSCTLTLTTGTRYVTARFSPVTLKFSRGEGNFGSITVRPRPAKACTFDYDSPCEYPFGTIVTLSRSRSAAGYFWVGACDNNRKGLLDADVCRLRLESNELVGAGYKQAGEIPPALGSGILVALGGSGSGRVTGRVINDSRTLNCGTRCSISGLDRNDHVQLRAVASRDSHFYRWSDFSRLKTRIVSLSSTTRIKASFVKN